MNSTCLEQYVGETYKDWGKTPIYNIAAGTCLGVNNKASGTIVIMKLCSDSKFTMWDLIKQ